MDDLAPTAEEMKAYELGEKLREALNDNPARAELQVDALEISLFMVLSKLENPKVRIAQTIFMLQNMAKKYEQ